MQLTNLEYCIEGPESKAPSYPNVDVYSLYKTSNYDHLSTNFIITSLNNTIKLIINSYSNFRNIFDKSVSNRAIVALLLLGQQ